MTSSGERLGDVMSAIRKMVNKETAARFDQPPKVSKPVPARVEPAMPVTVAKKTGTNLPSKIFVLQPYMRVDIPKPKPEILDDDAKIPGDLSALINEDVLRDMVREVVQEQLRGELGKQLMLSVKRDMVRALT